MALPRVNANNMNNEMKPQNSRQEVLKAINKQPLVQENAMIKEEKKDQKAIETENRRKYAFSLLEESFRRVDEQGIQRFNYIPLKALIVAPEKMFDDYEPFVVEITKFIQNNLSMGESASLVSKTRNNPIDTTNRIKVLQMISTEFIKYESTSRNYEYNRLEPIEKRLIQALVANEIIGISVLEPLFEDPSITEIICNGPKDVQVEIDGDVIALPSIKFRNEEHLEDLIVRLFSSVNKDWSRSSPLGRARLYDNSRVFAVHNNVAPHGPNLNIRRHQDDWVSPEQMIQWGALDETVMSYLGYAVNKGLSMLIVGGTGTGKALSYDTTIATPDGYTTMGDLKVGDTIYDRNCNKTTVEEIFEQGEKNINLLTFQNNLKIKADDEHNWILCDNTVRTTNELIEALKSNEKIEIPFNHRVIEYDNNKLELHPYALSLHLMNRELYEESQQDLETYLIKNNIDKLDYIPSEYETANQEDREWILKAFTKYNAINENGEIEISTINKKIQKSLIRIISSLGYFISDIKEDSIIILSKNWYKSNNKKYPSSLKLVSIETLDKKESMRCITVKSDTETFLCSDSNIITHNTTLLGALTGYFPDNKRIVSIEKNIELKGCPSKKFAAPMEEVPAKAGSLSGGVSLRELVEASTQMRPDVIILGECTGPETYDVLTAGNSGHQIFTTIHANSDQESMERLVMLTSQTDLIKGEAVYALISSSIDLVVMIKRFDEDGSRKITEISEVASTTELHPKNGKIYLPVRKIWEFERDPNSYAMNQVRGTWKKVGEISQERQKKHRIDMSEIPTYKSLSELY